MSIPRRESILFPSRFASASTDWLSWIVSMGGRSLTWCCCAECSTTPQRIFLLLQAENICAWHRSGRKNCARCNLIAIDTFLIILHVSRYDTPTVASDTCETYSVGSLSKSCGWHKNLLFRRTPVENIYSSLDAGNSRYGWHILSL